MGPQPAARTSGDTMAAQYVVSLPRAVALSSLSDLLALYPGVSILQQLDAETALVQMLEDDRFRLREDHPDLVVEPNSRYAMHHPH